MFGDKSHHDQTQDHVPHQGHITAGLEVAKTDLGLGHPKTASPSMQDLIISIPITEQELEDDF